MKAILIIFLTFISICSQAVERDRFTCDVDFYSKALESAENTEAICDDVFNNVKVQHMLKRLDVVFSSQEAVMDVEVESIGPDVEGQVLIMNFRIADEGIVKRKFKLYGTRNSRKSGNSVQISDKI